MSILCETAATNCRCVLVSWSHFAFSLLRRSNTLEATYSARLNVESLDTHSGWVIAVTLCQRPPHKATRGCVQSTVVSLCDGFVYCHPSGGVRFHALPGLVGASSDRELVTLPGGQVIGDYKVEMNETANNQATRHETDSTHHRTVLHSRP